ncbi:6-phospho-3-hexuloisomerase [Paenibacillus dauci]|uniref:6-phospho-3-hexuloisomerase n=1 Tax=Paenibacillus dauci TaxID=1567106 RepID=UPI000619B600|nr:6-phospho-3-hexuloisomerase [Paenibacillus dauci]
MSNSISLTKAQRILEEIQQVVSRVPEEAVTGLADTLAKGNRIFVTGEGRSGFMAKSFAMRLMHLGANSYVIGETVTPALAAGDILIAVSGSGTTKAAVWTAEKARELGCTIVAVTTDESSPLGQLADQLLHIPAATKYRREGEAASIQPLGSLFDQCTHILLDAVCLSYGELQHVEHGTALAKHSNVE